MKIKFLSVLLGMALLGACTAEKKTSEESAQETQDKMHEAAQEVADDINELIDEVEEELDSLDNELDEILND